MGLVREGNNMCEWININDKYPESQGRYIVLINKHIAIMEWGYVHLSPKLGVVKVFHGWNNSELNAPVTHWMSLPELPKDKNK